MYILARIFAFLILMPLFFITVIGGKNLQIKSGSIIIANHTSNWDPLVLGFIVKHKPVYYMAKEELYRNPIIKRILLSLHTIPLARGKNDIHAIKAAIYALKSNKMLGIFPEGTRSKNGELLPFQPGAVLLALKTNVPIIPVYIKGGYKPFHKVTLYIDEPVYLCQILGKKTTGENVRLGTEILYSKIKNLQKLYG